MTTSAPSRRCGAIWSTVRSKIVIDGPRNSSTGVPTTTISWSVRRDHRGVGAELEAAGRRSSRRQLVGAGLEERHLAAGDPVEGGAGSCRRSRPGARPWRGQGSAGGRHARRRRGRRRRARWSVIGPTLAGRSSASRSADGPNPFALKHGSVGVGVDFGPAGGDQALREGRRRRPQPRRSSHPSGEDVLPAIDAGSDAHVVGPHPGGNSSIRESIATGGLGDGEFEPRRPTAAG